LNFEEFLNYTFEIIINECSVVLISVVIWHLFSAEWAAVLIIHISSHALDAESVSARKQAAFNHKV